MHTLHCKWLIELENELELLNSSNANEEAHHNMFSFGFNAEVIAEWGVESTTQFIECCYKIYSSKFKNEPMWFYAWYDEMVAQLRIGAVSVRHSKLPFRCQLNFCDLKTLVNGIFEDDSGLGSRQKLNVWKVE